MTWTVIVGKSAGKQAAKLPAKDRATISSAIRSLADDPFAGDILRLEGARNGWRCRVGSYRIFFTIDGRRKIVAVSAIVRRTSTTY